MLDRAHVGDIEGALGTISSFDTGPRRSLRRRLVTLLAIMGPGLVVMVADNDAGGLAVYSQAGQDYGVSLLWVLAALARFCSSTRRWWLVSARSPARAMLGRSSSASDGVGGPSRSATCWCSTGSRS